MWWIFRVRGITNGFAERMGKREYQGLFGQLKSILSRVN
jgi:hypothetical protein